MEDAPILLIRDKKASDFAFFHSTYYNSHKKDAKALRVGYQALAAECKWRMNAWLDDPSVRFTVATPADDDDLISGVCASRDGRILWSYIRLSMRPFGVQAALEQAVKHG